MACLTHHDTTALDDLPLRILSQFDEQPGLRLTFSQVRRLWDVPEVDSREALAYLVHSNLLRLDPTGQYCLPHTQECTPWICS